MSPCGKSVRNIILSTNLKKNKDIINISVSFLTCHQSTQMPLFIDHFYTNNDLLSIITIIARSLAFRTDVFFLPIFLGADNFVPGNILKNDRHRSTHAIYYSDTTHTNHNRHDTLLDTDIIEFCTIQRSDPNCRFQRCSSSNQTGAYSQRTSTEQKRHTSLYRQFPKLL